jgi:hypothetical protein
MVLRYCRFFWTCLQAVWNALQDLSLFLVARTWNVDRSVMVRTAALKNTIHSWIAKQYQEQTNGDTPRSLMRMIKIILFKIGLSELMNRWYCYRYPRRFSLT